MNSRTNQILLAGAIASVGLLAFNSASVQGATLYSNGFETDTTDWSPATRVASGTNGIPSSSGSFHAETTANSGTFGRWGAYNYGAGNAVPTTFQEYTTSLDIYLDVNTASPNNTRFDFSSAINTAAGTFFSDFIFNGGFYDDATGPGANTDRFVISASNNSQPGSAFAKNPLRNPIAISATGWYTFEHHFFESAGLLQVDMSITDSSNASVGNWSFTSSPIAAIGGNRYGWFDFNEFPVLAFDNTSLTVVPEPATLGVIGLASLGLLARRRRNV